METRSKAQRDTLGADARGSGFMSGQGDTHPACDPTSPVLVSVSVRATPVLTDTSSDDAERSQEHSDLRHRRENLTLIYCLPAWSGFCSAAYITRLIAFLKR